MSEEDQRNETRSRLNSVSPSFCLAKWKQVSIHLQNGQTHSCHHPPIHPIPLSELENNPSALHNTEQKKEERRLMLSGKRPKGCEFCWSIEDLPGAHFSDRTLKSQDHWAKPYFEEVSRSSANANVLPSYLEVSFSHTCNFKCSYCSPHVSSKWMQEILQYGPYPTHGKYNALTQLKEENRIPISDDLPNPYREAFWKWWPELYPHLHVMRITGGEPLLSADTMRTLNYIDEHPRPKLELSVNSNLGVSEKKVEELKNKVSSLLSQKKIQSFSLFTSMDTYGAQAEYIRNGLNFKEFEKNIQLVADEVKKHQEFRLSIMCTYNALSVPHFRKFLKWVLNLKAQFGDEHWKIFLDINYLRNPFHLNVRILTPEFFDIIKSDVEFMKEHQNKDGKPGFGEVEIIKLQRLHELAISPTPPGWIDGIRKDFIRFINEHDRRRGTDFLKTFPEMTDFYNRCKKIV